MGGIENYLRALVPELAKATPESSFTLFVNPRGAQRLASTDWPSNVEFSCHSILGHKGLKAASELTALGALAGRKVDLVHSVAMTAPLWTRAANVVMLPDLTWLVAPDPGDRATNTLWRLIVPPVARLADRVIVPSHATADHVVTYLRVDQRRIDVVPLAAAAHRDVTPTPRDVLRRQFGLGAGPIILTVAAKRVNKNLPALLRALPSILVDWPDAVLVIPGNPTPHERELRALAAELGIADSVVFPPYVSPEELEGLYHAASVFVFASINEGFGLPILEAMRRGVPVACSNVSSLPEVAGDAARYFDPTSVEDIAGAISDLLANRGLANDLAERGRRRERQFTWARTAQATLESYERASS